jgi:hypothetical protein
MPQVDNDYFLIPLSIRDHEGPLLTAFPTENRLLPQGGCQVDPSPQCAPLATHLVSLFFFVFFFLASSAYPCPTHPNM